MLKSSKNISNCCSFQSANYLKPPEQRKTRRLNGLQLPLHPQQIVGWLILLLLITTFIIKLLPQVNKPYNDILKYLVTIVLIIHISSHLLSLLIDPSSSKIRKQPSNIVVPEFDKTKHQHVIENGRCHLCNITISSEKKTKHCSVCNKCIDNFDHHCMWLNNCIGKRNYKFFIICIVSAIVSALISFLLSFIEIATSINYYINNQTNNTIIMDNNTTLPITPIQDNSSLIIITIVCLLSAIAAALLIHLCVFHGYITYLGITTYEYVKNKRELNNINNTTITSLTSASATTPSTMTMTMPMQNYQPTNNRQYLCLNNLNNNNYHFCNNINNSSMNSDNRNHVYICSTTNDIKNNIQNNDKRNFHLYFSYKNHEEATSIELTSQTIETNKKIVNNSIELKPSTPSPVSCCFSIIKNHNWSDRYNKNKNKNQHDSNFVNSDDKLTTTKCKTVKRIQKYLRTRLRKNTRQKKLDSNKNIKGKKNRVSPVESPDYLDLKDEEIMTIMPSVVDKKQDEEVDQRIQVSVIPQRQQITLPPLNLSTTDLSNDIIHENKIFNLPVCKRNQQQLRIRRSSFNRRPRFKISQHVTQSAQLSPIPESELSKPTSPRSPIQKKHFFPDD
ncbi:putative uncharacterized protein DDB_G0292292 [Aphidius gifuensis]|uniref:putative uncharacterized protein DDB_G0292292 n=1 Tax=Aphidius gifuensis TaxID=684658 RepID=UPI001CDCE61D|nr:putative uncharacterized protein DDB_G0292292 [Aphidius gifuensis]